MVAVYAIAQALGASKFGLRLHAFREEEDAARALGIRTFRIRLQATALSALLTAMAGTFYAQYLLFIDPDSVLGVAVSLQMALLTVVGGIGTPIGPVVGAYLVVPFGLVLRAEFGATFRGLHLVVYGVGLILVLYYLPEGVWPALERLAARRLRPRSPSPGQPAVARPAGGA
jgi:branched-chain amino acid transport system permease protein